MLGRGGMGEVYLAEDVRLSRKVAIKILPAEIAGETARLQRFKREASVAATLNHPNICTIHEIGEAAGVHFICMEHIQGTTLRERIASGQLELSETMDIAIQIVDALEEAGKKNIVHRDIKPGNIIITDRHQVKILDFGLAKILKEPVLRARPSSIAARILILLKSGGS